MGDVGYLVGPDSCIVAPGCSDILIHGCKPYIDACVILFLFFLPSIKFSCEEVIIFLGFPHECIIVYPGGWDAFIFQVIMRELVGVGGLFILGVLVGVEVVVGVWVDPYVVFVGSVVWDLIANVCSGLSIRLFQVLDLGKDQFKLHAKAFGLLVHALLHEFHHVSHLQSCGGHWDEWDICFRGRGVTLGYRVVSINGHHGLLHEGERVSVISFGNMCIIYVRASF
jgi:hypothetical protein